MSTINGALVGAFRTLTFFTQVDTKGEPLIRPSLTVFVHSLGHNHKP